MIFSLKLGKLLFLVDTEKESAEARRSLDGYEKKEGEAFFHSDVRSKPGIATISSYFCFDTGKYEEMEVSRHSYYYYY